MTGQAYVLDIETRPDPTLLNDEVWWNKISEKIEAPSNYKDPLKIEAYKDAEMQKQRDAMALSPLTGMVAMIGLMSVRDGAAKIFRVEDLTTDCECEMLEEFTDWLGNDFVMVGWNIVRFDHPFLVGRCVSHGIEFPRSFPRARDYTKVIDLKELLGGGSLSQWAYVIAGEFKEVDGPDLLKISMDQLEDHLRDDLVITTKIASLTEAVWRVRR